MTSGLEQLAWASLSEDIAIKRAAHDLGQNGWGHLDAGASLQDLKKFVKLTCPPKGKIRIRQAAIKAEWRRQQGLQSDRAELSWEQEWPLKPRVRFSNLAKAWGLHGRGMNNIVSLKRQGESLLIFFGNRRAGIYRRDDYLTGVAIKDKSGRIDLLEGTRPSHGSAMLLSRLTTQYVKDELLARIPLEGGSLSCDLAKKRTIVSFPTGEEVIVDWRYKTVREGR